MRVVRQERNEIGKKKKKKKKKKREEKRCVVWYTGLFSYSFAFHRTMRQGEKPVRKIFEKFHSSCSLQTAGRILFRTRFTHKRRDSLCPLELKDRETPFFSSLTDGHVGFPVAESLGILERRNLGTI